MGLLDPNNHPRIQRLELTCVLVVPPVSEFIRQAQENPESHAELAR